MLQFLPAYLPAAALLLTPSPATQEAEGVRLQTNYASIEVVQVTREVNFGMETTAMELEVDGEPQEGMGGMMGGSSSTVRSVHKDDFLKVNEQGVPTHIKRSFAGIQSKRTGREGEERELDASPMEPQDGLVLDIRVTEEGEQKIKVLEGEAPENEAFMEKQPMVFAIDGLLPEEAVAVDQSWELENDAIRRALGNWSPARRPRPEGERGFRRRGEDRAAQEGRRRQGFRRMGGGMGSYLRTAEWEGEATLVSLKAEFEDAQYALIEFKMSSEGVIPERERSERGGRRRGGDDRVQPLATQPKAVESDAEIEIKGKLYFDLEAGRPVTLLLEGELGSTTSHTSQRGDREISMYMEQEGEVKLRFDFAYETR